MLAGRAPADPGRDRPRRPDAARHPRARRPDDPGHRRAGRGRPAQRAARHAHHRGGRAARVRPRHVHAHRPRHRGRDDGVAAVRPLGARRDHAVPQQDATCYNFFLLRLRPGTDAAAAAATLTGSITKAGCPPGSCAVATDQRPSDIKDYASVRDTPLVLAAVLIVFAVGTLAHVLLTGVRRRRRDLALLKTLGFARSQVLGVVAWEASAFAVVALLIGLPLGDPRRPLGLGLLRQRGRRPRRRERPAHRGAARHPRHHRAREPHRRLARLDRRQAPPRARPADGVTRPMATVWLADAKWAPTSAAGGGRCSASCCCSA